MLTVARIARACTTRGHGPRRLTVTRGIEAMKTIGILLIVAGSIALIYGGFSYTKNRQVVDLGPLEITTSEQKTFPIPAVVGAAVLIGGIVLLAGGTRRARSR
jgi:Na+/H+ antiporter NhaC